MKRLLAVAVAGVVGVTGLTGCFSTVHRVTPVQMVGTYRTATVAELEAGLAQRDATIKTLNASVLVTASTGGGKEGKVKTYTSFRGYIFVRKPEDLRVILQLPVIGSRALDMVSDGKTFTLLMASTHGPRAIMGLDTVSKPSKNGLENLRPAVFLDSLLVPGVGPDEYAALTESTHVLEAAHGRTPETDEPDYDLAVYKTSSDHLLQQERIVHISRVTMLPYEQDIFDAHGRVVTEATYSNYAPVGNTVFPRVVLITRPLDEYSLKIQVTKLQLNQVFHQDQFELKLPPDIKIERME